MTPELHETVYDEGTRRTGRVMGFEGPYVQLRPIEGGKEWDAAPKDLSPAAALDQRDANRPGALNRGSGGEREGEAAGAAAGHGRNDSAASRTAVPAG